MMDIGLAKLYAGEFNSIELNKQADGSVIVTLDKADDDVAYRFRAKNLWEDDEELVEATEILTKPSKPKETLRNRAKAARKQLSLPPLPE